jgi:hypothetical protein
MNKMLWERTVAMRFLDYLDKQFVKNHDPTIEEAYSSSLNTVSETERLKSNPIPTSFQLPDDLRDPYMLPDRVDIINSLLNEDAVKKVQKQVDPSARKFFNESDLKGKRRLKAVEYPPPQPVDSVI